MRSNAEGSSDKYARMIAGWLVNIGWVRKCRKDIVVTVDGENKVCNMSAFAITAQGLRQQKHSLGVSSAVRTPKRVLFQMLATKAPEP